MQRNGYAGNAAQPAPGPASTATPADAPPQAAGTILYDAQGNPVFVPGATGGAGAYPQAEGQQTEAGLPAPEDPEIGRMQASIEQAREQSRLTDQRYNQLAGNSDPLANEASAVADARAGSGGSAAITSELPDFLRDAVENPPGGNPEVEARLDRMRAQVISAPSLGKVTSYDKDWGVVTFNAGAVQGVKIDQRFAVRRGGDILGWVKVDQVEEGQSIAVLVTKNRDSDTAMKPDVGDDLIDFELF